MDKPEIINNRSFTFRGAVIHETAVFERVLDIFLANHFCKDIDTVNDFVELVLGSNRISLDGKRKMMEAVLKRKSIITTKEFATDLNTMFRERNNFAHLTLAFGKEAFEKYETHIGLIKINANTRIEWYDQPRVTDIINSIRRCTDVVTEFIYGNSNPPQGDQ